MYQKDIYDGFVRVVRESPGDIEIVEGARISYGEGTKKIHNDRGLIRYLLRHKHMSPFQFPTVSLHIKCPIFVARQLMRHHTDAINEYSGRYSVMSDDCYVPKVFHTQSKTNAQGRSEAHPGSDVYAEVSDRFVFDTKCLYKDLIENGVSREEARIILPVGTYTEISLRFNLRSLLHFIHLRMDSHAQEEIRVYAEALWEYVQQWCPLAAEAFDDYILSAVTLTGPELRALAGLSPPLTERENTELADKIDKLPDELRKKLLS